MTSNDHGHVTLADTRRALHSLFREDPESSVKRTLLRLIEDELTPIAAHGRWKPSKLLIILAGVILTVACVFVYFSITR